jgi:hypothetical protein
MADPICDDTPVAFCAHPDLPPLMASELEARHQALVDRGDTARASVLARLAASAATVMVRELKRRADRGENYVHPTVLVGLWRDRNTRPKLRRLLRDGLKIQQTGLTWQDVRTWLQFVADHERERQYRELLMVTLLVNLAEQATRPDECYVAKVASRAREAADEWRASQALHAAGLPNLAEQHMVRALIHLWCAQNLAREWTPDEEALVRAVRSAFSWQIGFLGYGIAAKLVGAALNHRITRWRVRHLTKSSSGNSAISTC